MPGVVAREKYAKIKYWNIEIFKTRGCCNQT